MAFLIKDGLHIKLKEHWRDTYQNKSFLCFVFQFKHYCCIFNQTMSAIRRNCPTLNLLSQSEYPSPKPRILESPPAFWDEHWNEKPFISHPTRSINLIYGFKERKLLKDQLGRDFFWWPIPFQLLNLGWWVTSFALLPLTDVPPIKNWIVPSRTGM